MNLLHTLNNLHNEYSTRSGFKRNVRVCNTLIDMYVKCGCLENARRVFDEMEERTVVSWSAMIAGLAMHGQAEEALWLFSEMIKLGMKPNGVTFIGLLHACSHMGLIDEGRRFFASMTADFLNWILLMMVTMWLYQTFMQKQSDGKTQQG